MNLLSKNFYEQNEDLEALKKCLNVKNLGFEFKLNRKDEFCCSCGANKYNSEGQFHYKCTSCEAPVICVEFGDDPFVIGWTIIQTIIEESCLIMELQPYGLGVDELGELLFDFGENVRIFIKIDKANSKVYIKNDFDDDYYVYNHKPNYEKLYTDSLFQYDTFDDPNLREFNGYNKILKQISDFTGIVFNNCYSTLDNLLLDVYGYMQAPIYYDLVTNTSRIRDLKESFKDCDRIDRKIEELKSMGIDISKKTVIESFDKDFIEIKSNYEGICLEYLIEESQFYKSLKENNLFEYYKNIKEVKQFSLNRHIKMKILKISDELKNKGVSLESILKSFLMDISQENFAERNNILNFVIEKNLLDKIIWGKPLSYKYYTMFLFTNNIMSEKTFHEIEKKPTLDNIYKLL